MAQHSPNGWRPTPGGLSPGDIAFERLKELELDHLISFDTDPRGPLDAWAIANYETPPVTTLPVLGRHGLILEGGTNLLYSYPKVGKTELLTQMVAEWTDAGANVLYLTEEPFGNWKRRLAVHHCTSTRLRFYYGWGCDLSHVLGLIDQEEFDILVVDTLRNAVGFIEADGDKDVARVLHPLLAACAGRTCVCGYHARKMPGDGGRDISGHHSLYGAFDRALQMTPVEGKGNQRKILVSGRCMYDGDMSMIYEQTEPGLLRALDGAAVVEKKERRSYELFCLNLECRDPFEAHRPDAKWCSDRCRKQAERTTESVSDLSDIPGGSRTSRTEFSTESGQGG